MSGSPTVGEVDAMLQAYAAIKYDTWNYGNGTLLGKLDTLEQALEGDYAPGLAAWTNRVRAAVANAHDQSDLIRIVREYGKLAGSPYATSSNTAGLHRDVWLYWNDNSKTVESRAITYATPSANGSNTGDGLLSRLTEDARGNELESARGIELKTAECVVDQHTGGDRHAEVFRVYGANAPIDSLGGDSSGGVWTLPSRHAGTDAAAGSLLRNSSFQTTTASGSVTTLFPGWTLDTTTDISQSVLTAEGFREIPRVSGVHSLKADGNFTCSQKLSVRNLSVSKNVPYVLRLMWNREEGSGDGTVAIRLGSQTTSVAMAAQTGWNELLLPIDTNLWYENWVEDEADVQVSLASNTSGYVLFDDVIFAPMTPIDGTWYFLRGGATPWAAANATLPEGDKFTWTDTGGAYGTGKIQSVWVREFGYSLPNSGTPSVADPS